MLPQNEKMSKFLYSLTLLAVIICMTGCDDLCSNEVIVEKVNNSKAYKLIHFDRNCGATTGNSNQLSIVSIDEDLDNEGGNVFIASSNSGSNLETDRGVVAKWLNDSTVLVKYERDLTVFEKVDKVGEINVVYESEGQSKSE
jgi:hypothetical protein